MKKITIKKNCKDFKLKTLCGNQQIDTRKHYPQERLRGLVQGYSICC